MARTLLYWASTGLVSASAATFDPAGPDGLIAQEKPMLHVAELVAVFSCGLFTGAALYISLVEHPARMECGNAIAATVFAPSYRRATVLQVTLAALGFLASITAWLSGATAWWLVGGLLLVSVIPFTLIVIFPTNKQLLSPTLDRASPHAGKLLSRWAAFHTVRTIVSSLAMMVFLYLVFFNNAFGK